MREIYNYRGHPLLDEIKDALSHIVRTLDRYDYSDQALYVAQEYLLDELLAVEDTARSFKAETRRLRMQAAQIAIRAKDNQGQIPEAVKQTTASLYRDANDYEEARRVLQYGRWLLRYVGDGIAWHAYSHNRHIIRALASKESVPAVADSEGIISVRRIFRAIRRLGRDWLPILHDLTNCLRTADISIFQASRLVRIVELKIRKGRPPTESLEPGYKRKDDRSLRQEERMARILQFMQTLELGDLDPQLAGGKAIDKDVGESHNFESVSNAIAQARERGYGFHSPGSGVLYIAWTILENGVEGAISEAQKIHPEIFASTITFRSISARYEEQHQSLPITAMALSADDILDILFGRIGVVTIVNFAILEEYCSQQGIPLMVVKREDGGFSVKVDVGEFKGEVLDGLWDRLMLEGLSFESFADLIRSIIATYSDDAINASA